MSRNTRSSESSAKSNSLREPDEGQRLQKFLATAGVASRRNCISYISDGRVTVNNQTITDPSHNVQVKTDVVLLDGERLRLPKLKYILLNKPKGVLCTNSDPAGRLRAIDMIPGNRDRLFTVGRLDENTQGLLLLTNNGDLAERMAHPRYEVVRRYKAQVAGVPTPEVLSQLRRGMHFTDGFFRFRNVHFIKRRGHSAFLEIELREGKNREVRRMLARCGHKVIQLQRIAFGPLRLGNLKVGECRQLRSAEVRELQEFVARGPVNRIGNAKGKGKGKAGRRPARKFAPKSDRPTGGRSSQSRR
jgi:23S rRNA pseudouridine2605 synthase